MEGLKVMGHAVKTGELKCIFTGISTRKQAAVKNMPVPRKLRPRPARSNKLVQRIDLLTSKKNPLSQNQMTKHLRISPSTIQRVIIKDLDKVKGLKTP